jgi:hypothetical protein
MKQQVDRGYSLSWKSDKEIFANNIEQPLVPKAD